MRWFAAFADLSKEIVYNQTMPKKLVVSAIKRSTIPNPQAATANKSRLNKKEFKNLRKLSGWNVFQREKNQGCVKKNAEWASFQKEVAQAWKELPCDSRAAYEAEASYEQSKREKLQCIPLPCKGKTETQEVKELGSRWAKKIKRKRLDANEQAYRTHHFFDGCLGLTDSYSALREEHIKAIGHRLFDRVHVKEELDTKFYSRSVLPHVEVHNNAILEGIFKAETTETTLFKVSYQIYI